LRKLRLMKEFEVEVDYQELNNVFRIVEMMDLELVEMDYTERGAKILLRGLEVPENLVIKTIRDVLI